MSQDNQVSGKVNNPMKLIVKRSQDQNKPLVFAAQPVASCVLACHYVPSLSETLGNVADAHVLCLGGTPSRDAAVLAKLTSAVRTLSRWAL